MFLFQVVPEIQLFKGSMYPELKLQENAYFQMCCSIKVYSLATTSYMQQTNIKFGTHKETR